MRCPDENVLAEYVDHVLDAVQRHEVEQHIDRCITCRTIVSDLARMQHVADDKTITSAFVADTAIATRNSVATLDMVRHRKRTAQIVPGTMIGEYEVSGVLGAGGMGIVFAAVHPRIGKKAAIKILKRDLAVDPSSIVRFENEARAVNAIGHPNIVDIFGFGELANGDPYYVMEQVDGKSLHEWICAHGPVSLDRAMPILRQICDALVAAHERGIIHRDLKPANIMVAGSDEAPRVKVLDFGLAKIARDDQYNDELTMPGVAIGTPAFMSPEQFMGSDVDQRTDVYALGVIIYQMLCGCYPFVGATPSEIGEQHFNHTPTKPSQLAPLPERLDHVVARSLAKTVEERYASVRELRADLEKCAREAPVPRAAALPVEIADAATIPSPMLGDAATVALRPATTVRAVTPVPVPTPPTPARARPRWLVVGAAFAVATFAIAWIVFGRSDTSNGDVRTENAPATTPIKMPVQPPPQQPVADPAPTPVAETTTPPPVAETKPPIEESKETKPAVEASKQPVAAKKRQPRAPKKPVSTTKPAPEDDDKMLLDSGAVKKAPR